MKNKERIITVLIASIVAILASAISAYAATSYLYNADEVSYDKTNSELTATDVQGAIDQLYTKATEYTSLTNRVSSLESWKNSDISIINESVGSAVNCATANTWCTLYTKNLPAGLYIVVGGSFSGALDSAYTIDILVNGSSNSYARASTYHKSNVNYGAFTNATRIVNLTSAGNVSVTIWPTATGNYYGYLQILKLK